MSAHSQTRESSEGLRVLIVGLNYTPEPTGNAPYTTRLAEGLKDRSHAVQVITGYPHYPGWKVVPGYRGLSVREMINDVPVRRLRHTVPSAPRGLNRLLMELTFGFHTVVRGWRRPDVVLVVTPALFAAGLAVLKARLLNIPVAIWVQDLYSRGLEETNGNGFAARVATWLEAQILGGCTAVTVIHDRFRSYVVDRLGVPAERVTVIRNWTHVQHHDDFDRDAVRERLGWGPDDAVALHAGNMGVKQGLHNVVEAARLADTGESKVKFVLVGDGNQRRDLESQAEGVDRIEFMRSLDDREYSDVLRSADVLIVNELPELREMSVPSKLTSYFSTGLPVVAATHSESATADEIEASGAGVQVDPGEPRKLLEASENLASDPERAQRLGAAGRPYAERVLSESASIDAYSDWLRKLTRH